MTLSVINERNATAYDERTMAFFVCQFMIRIPSNRMSLHQEQNDRNRSDGTQATRGFNPTVVGRKGRRSGLSIYNSRLALLIERKPNN